MHQSQGTYWEYGNWIPVLTLTLSFWR